MNENNNFESNIPFERAFKRLRVDGDQLPNNDSNDKLISNTLFDNMPCTSSKLIMWEKIGKSTFDESYNSNASSDKVSSTQSHDVIYDYSTDKFDNRTLNNKVNQEIETKSDHLKSFNLKSNTNDIKCKCDHLINDLKKASVKSSSNSELTQNCSHQARNESDITVDELAGYLDLQLYLPKKMSFMAELAYS